MNYMQIEKASVSNGPGFRVVLWVAGCTLHCACCHNPETWDFQAGKEFDDDTKEKMYTELNREWVKGITFTGGHPLEQQNIQAVYSLICEIKRDFPDKDIWLYTGLDLTIEDFTRGDWLSDTLWWCDVVVDGRFIAELRDTTLAFRGSSNQRLIDVHRTTMLGEIVLWEPGEVQ